MLHEPTLRTFLLNSKTNHQSDLRAMTWQMKGLEVKWLLLKMTKGLHLFVAQHACEEGDLYLGLKW